MVFNSQHIIFQLRQSEREEKKKHFFHWLEKDSIPARTRSRDPDLGFGLLSVLLVFVSCFLCSSFLFRLHLPSDFGKVPVLCPGVTQYPSSHYGGNSIPGCQDTSTWKPRGLSTRKLHLSLEAKSKEPTGGGGGGSHSGQQGPARALRAEDT